MRLIIYTLATLALLVPLAFRPPPIRVDFSGPYEGFAAMIACDGRGHVGVARNLDDWPENPLYGRSIMAHERHHVRFIETFWPDTCKDDPSGSIVVPESNVAHRYGECLAHLEEMRTLMLSGDVPMAVERWGLAEGLYGCSLRHMGVEYKRVEKAVKAARKGAKAYIEFRGDYPPRIWYVKDGETTEL